jgi:iron complex transport system substrate-binding protein
MAAHQKPLAAAALALALLGIVAAAPQPAPAAGPRRIICLIPAVTEMLFAIGAGPQVTAVSSYDTFPPEAAKLPKVGALLDHDLERILALRPDLVIVYATQTDLKRQLERAGIPIFDYQHAGLADITQTLRRVAERTGHAEAGAALAGRIDAGLAAIAASVKGLPRPRTMLVFGRERLALRGIYASGGVGFLHDMLTVAGGDNVFADIRQQSVQATTETIIARRPDVILEVHGASSALAYADQRAEIETWQILSSVPAVRNHRIEYLTDDRLVIPGPRVVEGTRLMAHALHPEAVQ